MIKINLSLKQKKSGLTNLGGVDFTKIKIGPVLLAIFLMYVPDLFFASMWEDDFNAKNQELTNLQDLLTKKRSEVSRSKDLEKQIQELKAQEENLGRKLIAVKQAISVKRNPSNLLLYIAKNIPDDLWIKELSLEDNTMIIKGEGLSYTGVGNFVNNLRSSIFISDASIKSTTSNVRESDKRRIETFEVHFTIARLE
jgi:Tfp pilus assembly protein PilN